jgi:hypothetical protein
MISVSQIQFVPNNSSRQDRFFQGGKRDNFLEKLASISPVLISTEVKYPDLAAVGIEPLLLPQYPQPRRP